MKIFIFAALFFAAHSAVLDKRPESESDIEERQWWSPEPPHWWTTDNPQKCTIVEDAKFLEGLLRAELILVRLTSGSTIKNFLQNKTGELMASTNSAIKLFEITATEGHGGPMGRDAVPNRPNHRRWSPMNDVIKGMDQLERLNLTQGTNILHQTHWRLRGLMHSLDWPYSTDRSIHREIRGILLDALSRCRDIIANGCKEEAKPTPTWYPWGTTESPDHSGPTWYPWGTTESPDHSWEPWRTTASPDRTRYPWETDSPDRTRYPWETTGSPDKTRYPWETDSPDRTRYPWETTGSPDRTRYPWETDSPDRTRYPQGTTWYP